MNMDIGDLQGARLPTTQSLSEARTAKQLDELKRTARDGDAQSTATQFETLFGVMLVRELRRSMPKSMFGTGPGADVYEGWFDENLGKALGERHSLGIAGMVKAALGNAAREAQP